MLSPTSDVRLETLSTGIADAAVLPLDPLYRAFPQDNSWVALSDLAVWSCHDPATTNKRCGKRKQRKWHLQNEEAQKRACDKSGESGVLAAPTDRTVHVPSTNMRAEPRMIDQPSFKSRTASSEAKGGEQNERHGRKQGHDRADRAEPKREKAGQEIDEPERAPPPEDRTC